MSPQQLFAALNVIAMSAWLLLAIFPRRRLVVEVIAGTAVPCFFAAVYIGILAYAWGETTGGFSSLDDVAALFSNPWVLLAGWTHYLAFDLLVGVWEVRDSGSRHIPHWMVVPCLLLTFMFGPAGWAAYTVVRTLIPRTRT